MSSLPQHGPEPVTALEQAKLRVAQASQILAAQGVLDAFGHVSRRHPGDPNRFLISRRLAPALVTPDDVVELDLDGAATDANADVPLFLERFIHGEIYRIRPDVQAVAHSHAAPVLPFTVVPGARLRPICHTCGFLGGAPGTFDVADYSGPSTNLLIGNAELGRRLAEHLGGASVVGMRAHGFTTVAHSVEAVVYRAVYTMRNCELDLAARALGTPTYLTDAEAAACEANMIPHVDRPWDLWIRDLEE